MIMTKTLQPEKTALTLRCPVAHIATTILNKHDTATKAKEECCIGSKCMLWQVADVKFNENKALGHCGLVK
jgi:hypothetical protein